MAFVAVVTGYGVGLGLAEANKPGYHPIPFHWCRSDDFDQMHQHADAMNLEHFELSPEQASDIVVTTMRLGS